MFGRNAIVKELGVRAPAMVSRSKPWLEMAQELKLDCKANRQPKERKQIGMDIALEESLRSGENPVVDQAIQRETNQRQRGMLISSIRQRLPTEQAEATIEQLERGDMTDEQVIELLDFLTQPRR